MGEPASISVVGADDTRYGLLGRSYFARLSRIQGNLIKNKSLDIQMYLYPDFRIDE